MAFFPAPPATLLVLAGVTVCSAAAPPAFHFLYTAKDPIIFTGSTTDDLRSMAPPAATVNPSEFPITGGVTEGKVSMRIDATFREQEDVLGLFCVWPRDVNVTLIYQAEVYIAKEYKRSSCRYAETYAHEMRHVNTDKQAIQEFVPGIEKTLDEKAANFPPAGPLQSEKRETARTIMLSRLNALLKGSLDKLEETRQLRQRAIDTPAEYQRLSRACPGEPPR